MKNNLFYYATSELSQDAFICWLMSFAMKDAQSDDGLKGCAISFIRNFIPEISSLPDKDIYVKAIQRQYKNIDVLLDINEKYKVIIEDKTFTKQHSDQLSNYKKQIALDSPQYIVTGIYYKIGFQSDMSPVQEAGYSIIDRSRILSIMAPFVNRTDNQIFLDYYNYYYEFERDAQKYKDTVLTDWNWKQIYAFFDSLKNSNLLHPLGMESNYDYVPNQAGGFYGMWIFSDNKYILKDTEFELYLQIEHKEESPSFNICFKVAIKTDLKKMNISVKEFRDLLVYRPNKLNQLTYWPVDYGYSKPGRFGNGWTMTLGIFNDKPQTYSEAIASITKAINKFHEMIRYLESTGVQKVSS